MDLANGAVTSSKLADNNVTSAKIQDGQVDGAVDITPNSIQSHQIKDGTINKFDLEPGAVTLDTVLIATGAVPVPPPTGSTVNLVTASATCPAGFKVTGGGFSINIDQGGDTVFLKKSAASATGWDVQAINFSPIGSGRNGFIESQAVCTKTFP